MVYLAPRETEASGEGDEFRGPPGAALLGWQDDDFVYLIPDAAYNTACNFERAEGGFFPLKRRALYKMLQEDGGLVPGQGGKATTVLRQGGKTQRVLKVPKVYFDGA